MIVVHVPRQQHQPIDPANTLCTEQTGAHEDLLLGVIGSGLEVTSVPTDVTHNFLAPVCFDRQQPAQVKEQVNGMEIFCGFGKGDLYMCLWLILFSILLFKSISKYQMKDNQIPTVTLY